MPAPGLPFRFERYFNSQTELVGPFGYCWSHSYHWPLKVQANGSVQVLHPEMARLTFVPASSGGYLSTTSSKGYELTSSPAGLFTLKRAKLTYSYDATRQLVAIRNEQGHQTSLAYDPVTTDPLWGSLLTRVTDSVGRTYTLSWTRATEATLADAKLPTTATVHVLSDLVQNATGRRFRYIDSGALSTYRVHDSADGPAGSTGPYRRTYTYSIAPPTYNLLAVLDVASLPLLQVTYDGADRVLSLHKEADAAGNYTRLAGVTQVTRAGRTKHVEFTANNRLTRQIDFDGTVTVVTYAPGTTNILRREVTDPLGNRTTTVYQSECGCSDAKPISITDPQGRVTLFDYDANGNQIQKTDPLGRITRSTYDSGNRLLSVVDPLGHATQYSYNPLGLVATETDALGNTTAYEYDALGQLIRRTDAAGGVTQYAYDAGGRVIQEISPGGSVTTSTWDPAGRVLARSDGMGNVTTFAYSYIPGARIERATDPRGHATQSVYGGPGLGTLTAIVRPLNARSFTYDAYLNRIADSEDPYLTEEYDAWHRHLATWRGAGTGGGLLYFYDAVGNRTGVRNVAGPVNPSAPTTSALDPFTSTLYDSVGRVTTIVYPDGATITRTYDAVGNLVQESGP